MCVFIFFFFKQKTAYEMRISDWSSDVCSSDLLFLRRRVLLPLKEAGQHFDRMAAGDLTARVEVRNSNEIGQLFGALKRMQENLARTVSQVQIGRASCRERVCQYV